MKTSQDRILTTHVGSLPRGQALSDLLVAKANGRDYDPDRLAAEIEAAIAHVVERQITAGIDIGNDGEAPRTDFVSYITDRMKGFGRGEGPTRPLPMDAKTFPIWFDQISGGSRRRIDVYDFPQAVGAIAYDDLSAARAECAGVKAALAKRPDGFAETFMTAVSPGFASTAIMNLHYDTDEAYVFALARALKAEYELIAAEGFILQIDSPDLGMERSGYYQDKSTGAFLSAMEMHIAALNEALSGIPREQVRLHACYGNRDGPHFHDIPCPDILPVMYQANVGAIMLPFANPRHAHEIDAFRDVPLPDGMTLIPGVIETTNNYLEHPKVVAERLCRAAACVGDRERIIAGADCGFGTMAGDTFTAEDVVWAKLASLAEGAKIASQRLWA
jgi:5-methyltetrahydropteroyltriglutamate--homocysteine methyltransferase